MTNWDDHRIFLAIDRTGSIRKAAKTLGISHSTVLRRIGIFENSLGVRLFERLGQGYVTTPAGDDMRISSQLIEQETIAINRRIAGRDAELKGEISITLPSILVSHLLMPDIAVFRQRHPKIEVNILPAYSLYDLSRREADVAIRFSNDPPEDLFGRRVLSIAKSVFVSEEYLASHNHDFNSMSWIGLANSRPPAQLLDNSDFLKLTTGVYIEDPLLVLEAIKSSMGIGLLPCFMGDKEPGLIRLAPGNILLKYGLWVLTHEDLSRTARIRVFLRFIAEAIECHAPLLKGLMPRTPNKKTALSVNS